MTEMEPLIPYVLATSVGVVFGVALVLWLRFLSNWSKRSHRAESKPILFVGVGGSGKTSLIMALTRDMSSTKTVTTGVNVWPLKITSNGERESFALIDTVGQDFGTALSAIPSQSSKYNFTSTYAKALVLVVDVVPASRDVQEHVSHSKIDPERVKTQLAHYNDVVLEIFSGVTEQGGSIILFINKLDAIDDTPTNIRTNAENAYSPLIDRLTKFRGRRVEVITGSALTGEGVNQLLEAIVEADRMF